ncbi:MAG: lamin tail domain-containing protein, partial [Planctomycetes bacterium]|nr:lamin tail domain-containing protein [Planctomycetota bacterium]
PPPYTFRNGVEVLAGQSIIVFCDQDYPAEDLCEPHASFQIASDGTEPITLWGPVSGVDAQGRPVRPIFDQVWLPPLRENVSFGRYPDGAGPAPVPVDQVLGTFVFNPPGTSTFGSCTSLPATCGTDLKKRFCRGAPNGPGGNIAPRVGLETYSTNSPAAGEAVDLTVQVEDEKGPAPPNIAKVEVLYRVNGGAEQAVSLTYDAAAGVQQGVIEDADGTVVGPNPFNLWTYWKGKIPGQAAGAVVEFYLRARDAEGAEDTSPDVLCAEGVGPCDREFGPPDLGCELDLEDTTCKNPEYKGVRYVACRKPFRYTVGHAPRADVLPLVINEVVAAQDGLLEDLTEPACDDEDNCPASNRNCCRLRGDFIELVNSSATQTVDISGLWLSDGPFNPQVWQFPASAILTPGERLIVWLDRDGGQCPDPSKPVSQQPCFWECPDPTDVATKEYHTNFALNADHDEIFIFDTEANRFGLIHGVAFRDLPRNKSLSLVPDGQRSGCWVVSEEPTPRKANAGTCPGAHFQRGDSNASCLVDIADAIFTLGFLFAGSAAPPCLDAADANDSGRIDLSDAVYALGYLFLGSAPPPAPGPSEPGLDPSDDDLATCVPPDCS